MEPVSRDIRRPYICADTKANSGQAPLPPTLGNNISMNAPLYCTVAPPPTPLTMPPTPLTMPPTPLTMPPTPLTIPPTPLTMPPTMPLSHDEADELRHVVTAELLKLILFGNWSAHDRVHDVPPTVVLSSVPPGVHLAPSTVSASSYGVYASLWIREGVTIGPFCGQRRHVDQIDFSKHNPWMWEVLDTEGSVSHVVDASEPPWRTWLSYVRCARQQDEQNLELVQSGNELFYRTTKPIPPDQELLIWYGSRYLLFFGMLDDANYRQSGHLMAEEVTRPACTVKQMPPVCKLQCTVCRRGFNSKSNLRSHMRIHTLEKPFLCQYCHRSFSQSSTLRNHVRLHTGERPYKCHVCRSAYSQLAGLRAHQKSSRHRKPANAAQRTDRGDKPSYPDTHHADDASP